MPLKFIRNDVTKMDVDALVAPANSMLEPGDGASRSIYRAAGEVLVEKELRLSYPDGCKTGGAVITHGHNKPAKWIIHAVCPQWLGGDHGEGKYLHDAYMNALRIAEKHKCRSIAFPLLSTGSNRFPRMDAIIIATGTILEYLAKDDESGMTVYLVFFSEAAVRDGVRLFGMIPNEIGDSETAAADRIRGRRGGPRGRFDQDDWYGLIEEHEASLDAIRETRSLPEVMKEKTDSFRDTLLRSIEECGMTHSEVYNKARISKSTFSNIVSKKHYVPNKKTIIAMAIVMKLSTRKTNLLLMKAGYAFSDRIRFDRIMKYCFDTGEYDFDEINEMLIAWDLRDYRFPTE